MFDYEKLFKEVKEYGITQTHVAKKIGVSLQHLQNVQKRGRELTGTQITVICGMIHKPMDMFVKREVNDNDKS